MAIDLKKTNVVIVGLGAVGGVAVLPLARAGLDVIGLEAGTWLTPSDFAPDELRNNLRAWPQAVQKANQEIPTHRPNASAPYSPRPTIHPMMNAVGGTTLHYWGQSWRLNPWDFKVVSETTRRYGTARIPAGSTVEDWPFGLEELEPYYDRVEYELGVSGKAGNINGKIDTRGNIFEGPRRREYPMPPLRGTGFTEMMTEAAQKLGWQAFPGPAAINSRTYQNRASCVYHGYCNRGGCHVNAKGSTAVTTIPKAQNTGRLTVVTQAHVTTIEVDRDGRVSGVNYLENGNEYFQPADVVLLASYVYENVRMLLLSTSKAFPNGLSNNHGQVGRHYFSHNTGASVTALFPRNLSKRMIERFMAAGAVATEKASIGTMGPTTHAYGGTRMGNSPDRNVVDRWGFSHEAPHLGILGASVMGTSGAHNPTLTAQALAWRTAEHLATNWKRIVN